MSEKKLHFLAFFVPTMLVIVVLLGIFLPSIFSDSSYDFVYVMESYQAPYSYFVRDGRLDRTERDFPEDRIMPRSGSDPSLQRLLKYDISSNKSEIISFEEAQLLMIDASLESPDGYKIVYGYRGENIFSIFFGGYDGREISIEGKGVKKRLSVDSVVNEYYDSSSFRFIGWIMK